MSGGLLQGLRRLHVALEDLVARNMHVRITWRARVLRWNGRKGGTSSGAECPRSPWCRTWRGKNDFTKDPCDNEKPQ